MSTRNRFSDILLVDKKLLLLLSSLKFSGGGLKLNVSRISLELFINPIILIKFFISSLLLKYFSNCSLILLNSLFIFTSLEELS